MTQSFYGKQDYAFGQAMLTLSTSIGLTQLGLAELLSVSRKAVGRWEAGDAYPRPAHLKALLTFALEQRAFPDGRRLAICGDDRVIILWDLHSGECLQTLRRDRPYERLNITGIKGLSRAQKETLHILGAIENAPSLNPNTIQ